MTEEDVYIDPEEALQQEHVCCVRSPESALAENVVEPSTGPPTLIVDADGALRGCNRSFVEFWQLPVGSCAPGTIVARHLQSRIIEREEFGAFMCRDGERETATFTMKSGRSVTATSFPIFLSGAVGPRALMFFDAGHVSASSDAESAIMPAARFLELIRAFLESGSGVRVSLMLVNLHCTDRIHQTHGYAVAEQVMSIVGERLKDSLRSGSRMARMTTQEYAIAMFDDDPGIVTAREVLEIVRQPVVLNQEEFYLRATVGVAASPEDGDRVETLLQKAENAAAQAHGHCVKVRLADAAEHLEARRRHDIERDLNRGLLKNEFELHYQPIIELENGRITAMEALVRWRHPHRGLLLPDEFLDVASETGLITQLGYWGIQQACRDAATWQSTGLRGVRVAVNLSPLQLTDPHLPQRIGAACVAAGLSTALFEVEVTEDASLHMIDGANVFGALRAMDVQITIDDFGTGYASVESVTKLPAGRLKLDRAFTAGIARNARDAAIVRGIIAIGRAIGLTVIAEGVEEADQVDVLRSAGCHEIQGWLVCRPMPISDVLQRISQLAGVSSDAPELDWSDDAGDADDVGEKVS